MRIFITEMLRRKELKYYILIFSSFFTLFILLINIYIQTNNEITLKEEYYTNRELGITSEDSIEEVLEKTKHINNIDRVYADNYVNGLITDDYVNIETYISEKNIKLIKGKSPEKKEVILSKKYDKYYDKEVFLKIDNKEINLKVVGIFEDEKITNVAFVFDNKELKNNDYINGYNILVDETKNINQVKTDLLNVGYSANVFDDSNSVYKLIIVRNLLTAFLSVIVLIIIILNFLIFRNLIFDNMKEFSILKSVGYSLNRMIFINLIKNIIIFLFSLFISLFIYIILYHLINIPFYYISLGYLIIMIAFDIILNIVNLNRLLKKVNSIMLYKNNI